MDNHFSVSGVLIMIIASIIIGYYLTMTVLLRRNKTDNMNKMYQALLMGFWMGLVELLMVGLFVIWNPIFYLFLIILITGIAILTYLIYNQIGINENQFMLSMIEHHEMALEMATKVRPKTVDDELITVIEEILESQQRQIDQMYDLLKKNRVPKNITSLFY